MSLNVILQLPLDENLFQALRQQKHRCYKTKGGIIVWTNRIPDMVEPDVTLGRIHVAEKGGYSSILQKGHAVIVCGLSGRKIEPYYVPRDPKPCGEHALFATKLSCVTVTATLSKSMTKGTAKIERHVLKLNEDERKLEIVTELLWQCQLGEILEQPSLKIYNEAVQAAFKKAADPECTTIYYALPKNLP